MADIDVSDLMEDPDFVDEVVLIGRTASVGSNGRNVVVDMDPETVLMVVQRPNARVLLAFPDMARLTGVIQVWYKGRIHVQRVDGYSDVVVWGGQKYAAREIVIDAMNFGEGYTSALMALQSVSNNPEAIDA